MGAHIAYRRLHQGACSVSSRLPHTSFGLRKYQGGSGIEWPTVEYAPMPGLPALRVQGCEAGCEHEWADIPWRSNHNGQSNLANVIDSRTGKPAGGAKTHADIKSSLHGDSTQGAYCLHCQGWRGELGLEPTPEIFIAHLVLCLREWKRVLRDDGTAWVNLGDSYASGGAMNPGGHKGLSAASERADGLKRNPENKAAQNGAIAIVSRAMPSGLKPKDLIGIPWRFAFAAQADGWYLRSAITWCKSAPMPESVLDRPTKATEQIFLLAKNQSYYYDAEAVKEPASAHSLERYERERANGMTQDREHKYSFKPTVGEGIRSQQGARDYILSGSNMRDWQIINPQPFAGSHFAVFPERIPEIAISAGSSARGCCAACGAGWVRVVETIDTTRNGPTASGWREADGDMVSVKRVGESAKNTTGWAAQCTCDAGEPVPCVVLDPFAGSGTTLRVAARLGRTGIGVDISKEYLDEIVPQRMGDGIQMELTL